MDTSDTVLSGAEKGHCLQELHVRSPHQSCSVRKIR